MKDSLIKSMGIVMASLAVALLLIIGIYYQSANSYITGTIVGKHTRGYDNDVYYVTVSNDDKTMEIEVTSGQFKKYPLFENVYVDYDILKKAVSMTLAKEND